MPIIASDSTNVAIGVSLVALVVSIGAVVVTVKALNHDRSQTGTRQPLIARKGFPVVGWNQWEEDHQPPEWRREDTRWVRVRLINRANYPVEIVGPRHARLG